MTEPLTIGNARLYLGDCLTVLKTLPDNSVHCCCTSPPYFGLRDYGHAGQIGLEPTPDAYVARLVEVFREVKRVLHPDGTCWVNLGDSYANDTFGQGGASVKQSSQRGTTHKLSEAERYRGIPDGLKRKDLIGIPWRVAFALQADGWYLRQDIIWAKPNPMPESVTDRCTKAHEYVFLLSKSERYFYDADAIKEPASKGAAGSEFFTGKTGDHQLGRSSTKPRTAGNKTHKYVDAYENGSSEEHRLKAGLMKIANTPFETRNRRSVWTIPTQPYSGAHFAVYPPDLVKPCVLAGCPEGGTVLDPFNGSGTTGAVALQLGRHYIGIELNPDYLDLAHQRLKPIADQPDLFTAPAPPAPTIAPEQAALF